MIQILFITAFLFLKINSISELHRIDEGSSSYFQIDRIVVNPMSNPDNIFFNFNLPDTLTIQIDILSSKNDSIFSKAYQNILPGQYQFSVKYNELINHKTGKYLFMFQATKGEEMRYLIKQEILLL